MSWREDTVPACRCSAHPLHTDKRRWMVPIREERDFVVWECRRCTEIAHVPTIQVRVLPRGRDQARYRLAAKARQ